MRTEAFGVIIACLAALLSLASPTPGQATGSSSSPASHLQDHRHADFVHHSESLIEHGLWHHEKRLPQRPTGPVYRCHDPHPEIFGPAPPVEDCDDVIQQFATLTTTISVKLTEGCYQISSGNCTGLVCPQRMGESTITGALAAQYMLSPLRDECIAKGERGWWIDGQNTGIGVYLT
ncbi:hypothetical protein F4777DRAFT_578920 [Nemania sp. FL0916]|nr:hypothetical protein F4777DRAFT_578920 [Nemania sp. FL0916]